MQLSYGSTLRGIVKGEREIVKLLCTWYFVLGTLCLVLCRLSEVAQDRQNELLSTKLKAQSSFFKIDT